MNKGWAAFVAAGWTPVIRGMCGRSMAYALLDLGPQSYIDWSAGHGLAGGLDDDDDGDGLSNEQEYLFGGDPAHPRGFFRTVGVAP